MKIPIYDAFIEDGDEDVGLSCISIVDNPAMEKGMYVFATQDRPMMYRVQDDMEHCITSVVIRADFPVYRYDPSMGEYYIRFSKELIKKLTEKYSRDGLLNKVSVQHNGVLLDDITMVQYFIKDIEKGIDPVGFEDIEDGSLFATFKVNNSEVWKQIMAGEYGGLSMELVCGVMPTEEYVDEPQGEEGLADWLDGLFRNEINEVKNDEIDLEFDEVERADIARAISTKKSVMVDGVEVWVHSLGKDGTTDVAILYDPEGKKYIVKPIKEIKVYEPTKNPIGEFPDLPDSITDNDNVTVQRTVNTSSYSDLIHNRVPVMISYSDEKENPHTGYRQCYVVAYGYTKANNECLRVFQSYGDSRSASDGELPLPSYRLMLTRRCRGFKPVQGVEKYPMSALDTGILNWDGDKSMEPCIDHLRREDFDN
jgi:hypothetical protein